MIASEATVTIVKFHGAHHGFVTVSHEGGVSHRLSLSSACVTHLSVARGEEEEEGGTNPAGEKKLASVEQSTTAAARGRSANVSS